MPTQPSEACTHGGARRRQCDLPPPWDTSSSPRRPVTQALERPASRTSSEAERCHGHREAGPDGTGSESVLWRTRRDWPPLPSARGARLSVLRDTSQEPTFAVRHGPDVCSPLEFTC